MKQKNKKYRITLGTFDLIKGLGMIIVIVGHMVSYYNINKLWPVYPVFAVAFLISSSIMPMFFMITGHGMKARPCLEVLKKSISELLIPYFRVAGYIIVLFPLCHYACFRYLPGAMSEMLRYAVAFLLGIPKPGKMIFGMSSYWCSAVWFFLALFIAINVLNLILKIKNDNLRTVIVWLCLLGSFVCFYFDFNYFCLPQGLMATFFCYAGCILKKYKMAEGICGSPIFKRITVIGILIVLLVQIFFGSMNLAYGTAINPLGCLAAIIGGTLCLCLSIKTNNLEGKLFEWIRKLGVYSYWIICIHTVEETCIPWYYWSEMNKDHQIFAFTVELLIKFVLIVLVCTLLKKLSQYKYAKRRASYEQ